MREVIALGMMVLAACMSHGIAAQEDVLFRRADSATRMAARGDLGEGSLRQRLVMLDTAHLRSVRGEVERNGESTLTLNLFDDVVLSAAVDQTGQTSTGYWLAGRILGMGFGSVTLVANKEVIAGTVRTPESTYTIRTVKSGVLVVREIDSVSLLPEESLPPHTLPILPTHIVQTVPLSREALSVGTGTLEVSAAGFDDGSIIDVMVVYTANAKDEAGGVEAIEAEIDLRVAEMNRAFVNSGVAPRIQLVSTAEVDYTEVPRNDRDSRLTNTIDHLRNPSDGHMDEVHVWRDQYAADLVHLIVDGRFNSCGEAKRLRDPFIARCCLPKRLYHFAYHQLLQPCVRP